jgi:hypothetical protein
MHREGVERADAAARAQGMKQQRQLQERERQAEANRRSSESNSSSGGGYSASPSGGSGAGTRPGDTDYRALGKELLRLPPLPVDRNVLLGSWRLEGGGQQSGILEFGITGKGATPGFSEMMGFMKSIESGQLTCDMSFGRGMTFTPTTFSSGGAAGMVGGPVAYRSRKKQVIVAIPGDSRANPMFFEIVGPDRIMSVNVGCALVRVSAPAANTAVNAPTLAANARAAPAPARGVSATTMAPRAAAVSAPIAPNSLLGRAVALHRDKDFQPALALLQQAVKAEPNDARVHAYLASTYQWLGMGAESARAAETARRLDPNALDILR